MDAYDRFLWAVRAAIARTTGFYIDSLREDGDNIAFTTYVYLSGEGDATVIEFTSHRFPIDTIEQYEHADLVVMIETFLNEIADGYLRG